MGAAHPAQEERGCFLNVTMNRDVNNLKAGRSYEVTEDKAKRWIELGICRLTSTPEPAKPKNPVEAKPGVEVLNPQPKKAPKNRMARPRVTKEA